MHSPEYWKTQFLLRPDRTFLNFGSFGAVPKPILQVYQHLQTEMEADPVEFILALAPAYLKTARMTLGAYLNCDGDDIVCVTNPSYAVNLVAKSLSLKEGDEVLATNLEYGACDRTWNYYCRKNGAKYIRQPITLPLTTADTFVEELMSGVTPNTKLIFISHITSTTALKFPVEAVCAAAKKHGIPVFVDGAHGPGQIFIDIEAMDPDFYTGACHKWMMCPKGASFLYAKKKHQSYLDPLVVSWGYESTTPSHSQFLDYHETQGTRDLSAFCTIPAAMQFMADNNWAVVGFNCHALALSNAERLYEITKSQPLAPLSSEFMCQMISAQIKTYNPPLLHDKLLTDYNIQVPIMPQDDKVYIRYSINAYNDQQDLDNLFNALESLYEKGVIYH